jgi:hypothetical protein
MLKIIIASLCSKNKKYSPASKICGAYGGMIMDGWTFRP